VLAVAGEHFDDDQTRPLIDLSQAHKVSHYVLVSKIGSGGMGEVYLAEDSELNRKVALKFLSHHLCQDADCRARFKREAQAAARLNHPNIVTVYEVSEYNGRPFLAMEFVEGLSLRQLIENGSLTDERTVDLAIGICEGLNRAHQKGVVHRDIKPGNILLDAEGRPKVVDFGLASIEGYDRLTRTGSIVGTVNYMSPEQVRGEAADHRTDIFSFGTVFYEMLTGKLPFLGEVHAAVLYSIVNAEPIPLNVHRDNIREPLDLVIARALQKDPDSRYQNFRELIGDLQGESATTVSVGIKKETAVVFPFERFGTVISHYAVIERIGEGSTSEVYLAEDIELQRRVALKFLPSHLSVDADFRARFKREAQALARLTHPNIVSIYEVSEFQGRPFYAMEYIQGQFLRDLIRDRKLPLEQIIDIAIQVCEGLNNAHQAGIIHRDIKPANIIIDDKGRVRLLDFGLAKAQDSDLPSQSETTAGTISYMAPELLTGSSITPASDIFSLGVLLYQMLTGKLPFTGESEATIIHAIVNVEPEPLSIHIGEALSRLQGIIDRALKKDPFERYQQMAELLVDLKQTRVRTSLPGADSRPEPPREASVAVLPFVDMSPEKDQEYFCDGIAEELINALTRAGGLHVAARTSAFQYKGQNLDIRKIGKMLNVDHILEGSVRKAGNRIRITAELVNVADGYHLWAESFDRNMEDVFAIQDEISQAISGSLKVRLAGDKRRPLIAKPTEILEAYNLYLKGRYFWNKRYQGGLQKGMEYFKQVIDLDPGYARAYAGLSDSYNILAFYNHLPPLEACPKAKAAALKALEIDPDLAEAHTSLGWAHNFYDRDWVSAEKEFQRSLELNPNYAITCHYYGLFLIAMKRFDEGILMMKKARDLDPLSLIISASLGGTLYFARRFDEAIPPLLQAIEIDPGFALAHAWIAGAYVEKGLLEKATAECRKAESVARGGTYAISWLGFSLGVSGQSAEAREIARRLIDLSEKQYVSSYHIALVYSGLGDGAATMHWLEKAFEEKDNWLVWLGVHPAFDSVRNLPEFGELLRRVGL